MEFGKLPRVGEYVCDCRVEWDMCDRESCCCDDAASVMCAMLVDNTKCIHCGTSK